MSANVGSDHSSYTSWILTPDGAEWPSKSDEEQIPIFGVENVVVMAQSDRSWLERRRFYSLSKTNK